MQLRKIENETQEEYLTRMETILATNTEAEEMSAEDAAFMQESLRTSSKNEYQLQVKQQQQMQQRVQQKTEQSSQINFQTTQSQQSTIQTTTTTTNQQISQSKQQQVEQTEVDHAQDDYSDIQKEIDEVKQTIDAIDRYEETISKQEQVESEMSAEEIYLQRREERKVKKHVSFDLNPEVVHEYGESAETTEVEDIMTDDDITELTKEAYKQKVKESKEEIFEISMSLLFKFSEYKFY